MTLDTKVAIGGGAVNAREVFDLCRAMVNTPEDVEPKTDAVIGPKAARHLHNPGADAWLITWYGADGPLPAHECDDSCYLDDPEDMEADGDDPNANRCMYARMRDRGDPDYSGWASMILSFDTAYGYRNDEGMGCADLHRRYIEVLHAYTQRRGLALKWENEFTGEWFDGLAGLDDFGRAGDDALAWFRTSVVPALAAMGATTT